MTCHIGAFRYWPVRMDLPQMISTNRFCGEAILEQWSVRSAAALSLSAAQGRYPHHQIAGECAYTHRLSSHPPELIFRAGKSNSHIASVSNVYSKCIIIIIIYVYCVLAKLCTPILRIRWLRAMGVPSKHSQPSPYKDLQSTRAVPQIWI